MSLSYDEEKTQTATAYIPARHHPTLDESEVIAFVTVNDKTVSRVTCVIVS